jgi:GxxExxY protein
MVTSSYFLDSLLVSALASTPSCGMRTTVPYLRDRCVAMATLGGAPNVQPAPPLAATRQSFVRSSTFHVVGSPLSFSSDRDFVVRRLPRSNGLGGGSAITRKASAKTNYRQVTSMTGVSQPANGPPCKPWCLEWASLLETAGDVYFTLGDGHSEKAYQTALLYKLYQLDVPCLMERPVYVTENSMSILAGRVDLEVNQRFLLELKVSHPSAVNMRKDRKQLRRYITAYKTNGVNLERAALVYFSNYEVRVVEVSVMGEEDNRYNPY